MSVRPISTAIPKTSFIGQPQGVDKQRLAAVERQELQSNRTLVGAGLIGAAAAGVTGLVTAIRKTPNPVSKVLKTTAAATFASLIVLSIRDSGINYSKLPKMTELEEQELHGYRRVTDSGLIGAAAAGVASLVMAVTKTPNPVPKVLKTAAVTALVSLIVLPIKDAVVNAKSFSK